MAIAQPAPKGVNHAAAPVVAGLQANCKRMMASAEGNCAFMTEKLRIFGMSHVKVLYILPIMIIFSACSSGPTPVSETQPTASLLPAGQSFSTEDAGDGTLRILRDYSFTGVACKNLITVNGHEVARLGVKETATFYVPAGEVFVGTRHGCIGGETVEEIVEVEAGKDYYFRTGFSDTSTSLRLYRSSPF
jgi:hypothetical protein